MFARKMNTFDDYRNETDVRPMTEAELNERLEAMENIVFPAINEKVLAMLDARNKAFNDKHYIVDFPINSQVVVVIPENERSKLDTPHDGPFTVVRKTQGGSYVLKDARDKLLGRDYAPSQLKLISQDYDLPCDDIYVVDRIVAHEKVAPGKYKYLVRWEGYREEDDTWEPETSFTNAHTIHEYWKRLGEQPEQKPKKTRGKRKRNTQGEKSSGVNDSSSHKNSSHKKQRNNSPKKPVRRSLRFQ
ncbi:hypothetical protein K492DRAFT_139024 [Lichtheimia hyalospora FSU 10163]|nr:hypothetical protein K492DRAFT_139024 [Lichtheimia hyalospora FSU 10163]